MEPGSQRTAWRRGGCRPPFVGAFTLLGHKRAGYDARRHTVSALALGEAGWLRRANFVITGLAYLGAAAALMRAPRPVTNGTPLWLQDSAWSQALRGFLQRWLDTTLTSACGADEAS